MKSVRWEAFRDADGWYLATVKGKPSKRMPTKHDADKEAARRNLLVSGYERAVLEGYAGSLPAAKAVQS